MIPDRSRIVDKAKELLELRRVTEEEEKKSSKINETASPSAFVWQSKVSFLSRRRPLAPRRHIDTFNYHFLGYFVVFFVFTHIHPVDIVSSFSRLENGLRINSYESPEQ